MILLLELSLIFLTSRYISKSLFLLAHLVTHSKKISVIIIAFVFLPGVIIHELSHLLMAKILWVHTGKISLIPELHGTNIKLGSVEVEKVDPIRSFLIGIAPLIGGIAFLVLIVWYFQNYGVMLNSWSEWKSYGEWAGIGYVVFVIANTMFSSKKDLESALQLGLVGGIVLLLILIILGIDNVTDTLQTVLSIPAVENMTELLSRVLLIPVVINSGITVLFLLLRRRVGY